MPLLFVVWDEAQSPYFNDNIAASANPLVALVCSRLVNPVWVAHAATCLVLCRGACQRVE